MPSNVDGSSDVDGVNFCCLLLQNSQMIFIWSCPTLKSSQKAALCIYSRM
uniref:Uncharacterized protein n=1 Tax=Solanum lycopersicum TaxID=4081 RepID=K4CK23_SOLLC